MQELIRDLRSFKLSGMASSLGDRLHYAQNNKLGYIDVGENIIFIGDSGTVCNDRIV